MSLFIGLMGLTKLLSKLIWLIKSIIHLPLGHVSSPISETIHVNPLITTIKKNKIVSLLYLLIYLYIYVVTFIHFNYLILPLFGLFRSGQLYDPYLVFLGQVNSL